MPLYQTVAGDRILAADINQFYNLLKGVAASGEAVTFVFNAAGVLIFQPSSDPATGTEMMQVKNNAGTVQMALSSDGKVYAADGTAPIPGVTWEQDKDTGLYRITTNVLGFSAGGTEKMRLDATGVSLDGGTTYKRTVSGEELTYDRWEWYWSPTMAIESTLTGTGTFTASTTNESLSLGTGATSGGTSGIRKVIGTLINAGVGVYSLKRWSFTSGFNEIDANTTEYIFLTNESVTGAPSLTARHVGIKNVAGVVSFSTGDNTTEQTTAITAFVTAGQDNRFTVTFDGTTARLYIDGTLRATHATNVPTTVAANTTFRAYAVNSAAANKTLVIGRQSASFAVA